MIEVIGIEGKTYDGEIKRRTAGHLLFLWGHADHETPIDLLVKREEEEATSPLLAAEAQAPERCRRRVGEGGGGDGGEAPRRCHWGEEISPFPRCERQTKAEKRSGARSWNRFGM